MKHIIKVLPYRRKREGRTDYKKRLTMLVSGIPRMVIRRTNKNIIIQVIEYADNGDHVIITANSSELKKLGWKHATGNLPAAYLTGVLAAKKSLSKGISKVIIDLGLQPKKSAARIYSAVKGAIDAGLDIPCSEEVFPSEDRICGKHIAAYAKDGKFKTSPAGIEVSFKELKQKLMK